MQHRFGVPVLVITALALVSLRSAAQMTSAAVPAGSASGTWQVTTGVAYAPWTFDLTQTGTTLTGTVRQEGGLRGPARIRDGSVRGSTLSFKADSPSGGRIITFTGIIAGDSMDLTRSVEDPVGELSGAGVFGVSGVMRFTVHRAAAFSAAEALGGPLPGSERFVVVDGVGFPPWTFDLVIKDGIVTGLASQGRSDPATGITTSIPGPYAVVDGTVDGTVISFALKYNGGDRISTFRGARRGNQIDFTHSVQVVHGPPGLNGIVGAAGATRFTATLETPVASGPAAEPATWALASAPIGQPAAAPAPVGPAGTWRVVEVPNGPWMFEFSVAGGAVTGTIRESGASSGAVTIAAGTVDTASIAFTVLSPDAERTIAFRGRISGDQITFTRDIRPLPGGGQGAAGLFGAPGPTTFVARRDNPRELRYKDFTVDTAALTTGRDGDAALDAIRAQLDLVDAVTLDADTRRFLRTIPFVIVAGGGSAAYGGGRVTVPVRPDRAYDSTRPIFLIELLYAFHDLKMPDGFHNPEIEAFYERARASDSFAGGSDVPGNAADYFAMTAAGYLTGSAGPGPFTRAAIKATQPDMYRWLARQFGAR